MGSPSPIQSKIERMLLMDTTLLATGGIQANGPKTGVKATLSPDLLLPVHPALMWTYVQSAINLRANSMDPDQRRRHR